MSERWFDFARKVDKETGELVKDGDKFVNAYPLARLPEYSTKYAAGADFFCAEDTVIPSIWGMFLKRLIPGTNMLERTEDEGMQGTVKKMFAPTLVHTGIKVKLGEDEVLEIYPRSSIAKNFGLVMSNSVGIIDADYFECKSNDGEIAFSYYNLLPFDVVVPAGTRIGQGIFKKFLRPTVNANVCEVERTGGRGSTGK